MAKYLIDTWDELRNMKQVKVKLGQVYLDPNNPRFAPSGKERVPDERITEDAIQEEAIREISKTGISALMSSITTSGFWVIDRVVLRMFNEDSYVVVEGNRRITALKMIMEQHQRGRVTLPNGLLNGIKEFEALVYDGGNPNIAWIVQGFRHTPGIEPWQRYTQARFWTDYERQTGKKPQEIASIFGIKPRALASTLIRAYLAFEQAKNDEDYGEVLVPEDFGFFDEVIMAKPALREWLGWSDDQRRFTKPENLKEFLSWLPGEDKTRTTNTPRTIDVSPLTRDALSRLVQNEHSKLFQRFRDGNLSIRQCSEEIGKIETRREPVNLSVVISNLEEVSNIITILPIPKIQRTKTNEQKEQKNQILKLLEEIAEILATQIKNLKK